MVSPSRPHCIAYFGYSGIAVFHIPFRYFCPATRVVILSDNTRDIHPGMISGRQVTIRASTMFTFLVAITKRALQFYSVAPLLC